MGNVQKVFKNKLKEYKAYIILGIITLIFFYIAYEYYFKYSTILKQPDKLKEMILSYGNYSILIYIFMQILQVVVFIIPGEVVQIAGGYVFGTWVAAIISLIGIVLGNIISFSIANNYGKPIVNKIMEKKQAKVFKKILQAGSKNMVVFLFYLIPGIPKDILAYICGISDIKFKEFVTYSTLGRIPCIFVAAYFGSKLEVKEHTILIIIGVIMTILFIVGVLKGEKIIRKLSKAHSNK